MKKNRLAQNVLKTIVKSLKMGVPVTALALGNLSCREGAKASDDNGQSPEGIRNAQESISTELDTPSRWKLPPYDGEPGTFVEIDEMSLSGLYRHATPAIDDSPPWEIRVNRYKVQEGDTWYKIARRYDINVPYSTPLEILLRVNGVPADETYDILAFRKSKVESVPLRAGGYIFVPIGAEKWEKEYQKIPFLPGIPPRHEYVEGKVRRWPYDIGGGSTMIEYYIYHKPVIILPPRD